MNDEHRVSDSDRERAVVALRDASSEGRLTLEELSERTGLAYEARTHGELVRVTADLPAAAATEGSAAERRRTGWLVGVFGPVSRSGRWRVAARTIVLSLFSPASLDLRGSTFSHREATLVVVSLFAPVRIVVPEHVDAEVNVLSLFMPPPSLDRPVPALPRLGQRAADPAPAHRQRGLDGPQDGGEPPAPTVERGAPDEPPVEAPRLRVRGISLFGPVIVQHLPS